MRNIFILFICLSYSNFIYGQNLNKISEQIIKILQKEYSKEILDFSIKKQKIEEVSIYWSDPGFIDGPTIPINKNAYIICFATLTRNSDGTTKYKDNYTYSFIIGDSIVIRSNSYHGRGYHGGSRVILKNSEDMRYSNLSGTLVRQKELYVEKIEKLLKK